MPFPLYESHEAQFENLNMVTWTAFFCGIFSSALTTFEKAASASMDNILIKCRPAGKPGHPHDLRNSRLFLLVEFFSTMNISRVHLLDSFSSAS